MGLDISAWRRLERLDPAPDGADVRDTDTIVAVFASRHFPGRTEGLADGYYYGERCDALGPFGGFKAGSYSGYGAWREWLAELAGYPAVHDPEHLDRPHSMGAVAATGGPFWELINFYDNYGQIGPLASAKLAGDFAAWDERAKAASFDGWEYDRYKLWQAAFVWAADGGCVDFH